MLFVCFFFFKQKTAYEMRISDWSSDVCSSDLPAPPPECAPADLALRCAACNRIADRGNLHQHCRPGGQTAQGTHQDSRCPYAGRRACRNGHRPSPSAPGLRSEEHTSELQSLMRISYAVFCLKKKKNNQTRKTND